jgi:hypothetical protein
MQLAILFKINKTFRRVILHIGKEGAGCNIKVAVTVKICGYGFGTAVDGVEIALLKFLVALVKENI